MRISLRSLLYKSVSRQFLCGLLLVAMHFFSQGLRAQSALSLPFFDDFTSASARSGSTQPDPARWVAGSGVYINNTMAIGHPTINVATFDGLQANGRPYVRNAALEQGYTDTLESRPINLAGLTTSSGVFLSFYWQAKGLGELPDPGALQIQRPDTSTTKRSPYDKPYVDASGVSRWIHIDTLIVQTADSLTVQFKDAAGTWKTIWAKAGGQADTVFSQSFVQVPANYLHGSFAFRFRTYGRRSGPFDTWNIDYVYLNKGRNANDKEMIDIATQQALTPLLKRYTAMPLSQFKVKGQAELADTVSTVINNLINNPTPTPHRFIVRDELTGSVLQNSVTAPTFVNGFQRRTVKPAIAIDLTQPKVSLRYEIDLETADAQNPIFSANPKTLLSNDTISSVAVLDNYYAYDDGAWEYAYQIRQREQVAVRFALNKPDTVGAVRACLVPFTTDQTGQSFVITVYGNNKGKPGIALYQQSFTMQYPSTRNGFVDYKFTKNVIVQDTFYVGYQQIASADTSLLRIGFDKNSPFGDNIFYNGGANWEQNLRKDNAGKPIGAFQINGAFMLRPVMDKKGVLTPTTEPAPVNLLQTYPNPTTGLIRWDNTKLTRLEVMNTSGQTLLSVEPSRGQQMLDLSHLPDGLYLIRLFADQRAVVQKLIIQH
ncbi:T9SS type A sorting domain-containing protein [Spirosoma aerolatum]|uniref:T9SS type A sorting domain-containing protein n=1 Tax=Spirosoma aerolatum TaxID=1211326 RepID=UPI0009AF08EB|nr:T9SS type A sorting domain-containing protein [Spirosoma aerolatum]